MVWFGGDLIFKTYIYVFCELGPVKKKRTYTYVVAKGLRVCQKNKKTGQEAVKLTDTRTDR